MKNFAKYLVLFLVVAALVGVFAFSVFADTPAAESTVGQYTEDSATAWKPADDTVKYAVWATEADYKAGNDPVISSTTNIITETEVGGRDSQVKTFYVVLFADCQTAESRHYTGRYHTVEFNLAGHTLTAKGWRIGNSSGVVTEAKLTVKNGTVNFAKDTFQSKIGCELYFENVVYNVNGGNGLNSTEGFKSLTYKDCIINVNCNTKYELVATTTGYYSNINYINTEFNVSSAVTNPIFLFTVAASADKINVPTEVRFDKDCVINKASDTPLFAINRFYDATAEEDIPRYFNVPQVVYFEAGCVLTENIAPVCGEGYTYSIYHWNTSTGVFGNGTDGQYLNSFDEGYTDSNLSVKVVAPGTKQLIEWTNESVAGGVQLTAKASEGWVPTAEYAGITYGTWATEDDFLAGTAPTEWGTTATIPNDALGYLDNNGSVAPDFVPGYVRLYADVTSAKGTVEGITASQVITGDAQELTIDLNGYTYIDAVGFRVGGASGSHPNASLTIKNGVFLRKGGQFHLRSQVGITFDNVEFISIYPLNTNDVWAAAIFYGPAPKLLKFVNSNLTILTGDNFHTFSASGSGVGNIIFENSGIEYGRVAPVKPLFAFATGQYSKSVKYDIYFDENSFIKGDLSTMGLFKLTNAFDGSSFDINVYTELGFRFSPKAEPSFNCTYIPFGDEATGAQFTWIVVTPDTTTEVASKYKSEVTIGAYNAMYTYSSEYVAPDYQFVELDADGNVIRTWPVGSNLVFDSKTAIQNTNGSTYKFYYDTEIKNAGTYSDYAITFDLNGCTLTFTGAERFQLGLNMSGQWKTNRVVKFIDSNPDATGTLDFTQWTGYSSPIQNRPGTTIVFEDIDIKINKGLILEYGAKSISFKNVNIINAIEGKTAQTLFGGALDGKTVSEYTEKNGVREFTFDGCTFDKGIIAANWNDVDKTDNVKITVKGGTVLANDYNAPFTVSGSSMKNVDANIAADTKYTAIGTDVIVNIGTGAAAINLNGYKITALKQVGNYFVPTDAPTLAAGDLKANLTLFADFKVNFFANPEKITAIYTANKALLENETFGGSTKYTARFSAHEAADEQVFIVAVVVGDETVYANLSYSVEKYATKLMDANVSDDAKALVSSAMAYVVAAYNYAGKTAPGFAGESYEQADWSEFILDEGYTSAIKSVQLDLDSGFKLRFNVADDYNGTLVINGVSYEVVDGNFNGIDYVNIELRAFELYDAVIEIQAGEETGAYSLADYCEFALTLEDTALEDLVYALFDYVGNAATYKTEHPNLD